MTHGSAPEDLDVIVIGAGFAGLYALHRFREAGLSVRVVDAADGVGGTWYWNAYPGARCDVESREYSYSFSPELDQDWVWSERYAGQPEILRYINHVADRFDLRRDIDLGVRVKSATYDEAGACWTVDTEAGDQYVASFCVFATGSLSAPLPPAFPGLDQFEGDWYMTQQWPHEPVDFAGKRVAVVGTGASGIQAIPVIAESAAHLTVFQRTANYSIPGRNRPLSAEEVAAHKMSYPEHRALQRKTHGAIVLDVNQRRSTEMAAEEIRDELERRWALGNAFTFGACFRDLMLDLDANTFAQDFVREKIRAIVRDPQVADLLCPTDHPYGTKRPCVDHGYFEAFNRANVTLVSVRGNPISEITATGVRLEDGTTHDVDIIVFATGYDALSGALARIDIRGRGGSRLCDAWADGPATYLGLMVADFPNLFSVAGPGSTSPATMVIAAGEQHVDWIADCLQELRRRGINQIEATREAQEEWTAHVEERVNRTLYSTATNSYYRGANVPGKPSRFPIYLGGLNKYRAICDEVAANDYEGFTLGPSRSRSDDDAPAPASAGTFGVD